MLADVHGILRGGRGAVVTALADIHRMVTAAAAEVDERSGGRQKGGAAGGARGRGGQGAREGGGGGGGGSSGGGGGGSGTGLWNRGALSRLERKVFFLLVWANALVDDDPKERERERRRRGPGGGVQQEAEEEKEVWSLASVGEEDEGGESGTFELLRRWIEREMRTHAQARGQHQLPPQHRGGVGVGQGGGGGGGGGGGTFPAPGEQRRLVEEL
jgi:hypothetical protein